MRKTESQKIALCGMLGALSVVLLLLDQCTTSSVALDVPAVTLGMDNLLVTADGTMAADTRSQLEESAAAAGVDHVVICSGDAFA